MLLLWKRDMIAAMRTKTITILTLCICCCVSLHAQQQVLDLTLAQAIALAREQSPDAQDARHTFCSAYWNYRSFRADYLPSLTLTSSPYMDRAINRVTLGDGTVRFVEQNLLSTDFKLSMRQNVPWTGGTLFMETSLQRLDLFSERSHSYQTSPVSVGYTQSVFGYNRFKWDRKIEPIRYAKARKTYLETLELISVEAARRFFDLLTAQSDYEIARANYANADTLSVYAKGRYDIGTISESEMLQLELNMLTEESNLLNAGVKADDAMQRLRSYLGILDDVRINVILQDTVPVSDVDIDTVLALARENSPDMENMRILRLEGQSAVAQAKAEAGLKADVYLRLGLTQTAQELKGAYADPMDQQLVSVGISIPILDWGRAKGRIKVAKSNLELVNSQVSQAQTDFDLNVRNLVRRFNMQARRINVASRADATARRRAEVTRHLYLKGQSNVLDLNASIAEKDAARRAYITALYDYWSMYYTLRSLTLYDLSSCSPLETDYETLYNL